MLLDRRKVKFWQKIVFGVMAFLMAAFLVVGYSGVLNGCTWFNSSQQDVTEELDQQIAKYQAAVDADPTGRRGLEEPGRAARVPRQPGAAGLRRAEGLLAAGGGRLHQGRRAARRAEGQGRQGAAPGGAPAHWSTSSSSCRTTRRRPASTARSPRSSPRTPQSYFDMASVAINAGDTNTALLAFTQVPRARPAVPGRAAGQGLDRGEHAGLHAEAIAIADQLRGPVHE